MSIAIVATATTATAGQAPPQGVWTGTLGTKPIVACFNAGSPSSGYGSYYYLDHLQPIALSANDGSGSWTEENNTGRWTLSPPAQGVLQGRWVHPKTGRQLAIVLQQPQETGSESACDSDAYNRRLETPPQVQRGPVQTLAQGRRYRKLTFAGQETVELLGQEPALQRINDQLKLDQSAEAVQAYFTQRREFLGRVGSPSVDEHHTDVMFWNARFVTVKVYTWAAGEGRRGISIEYNTWDTTTGEPVDPWRWLRDGQARTGLPPALKKRFFRGLEEEPDCRNGYQGRDDYVLTFDAKALHFDEEAWGNGCEKSFSLPLDQAAPYFTPEGRQAAAALRLP